MNKNKGQKKYSSLASILGIGMAFFLATMMGQTVGCSQTTEEAYTEETTMEEATVEEMSTEETEETEETSSNRMEVHFLDVGQGDSTLILCDGHAMLIDAGNNDKGTLVQSYLQSQNVESLDYVIGTHPDADHIGGLDVVLYKFECETVILPEVEHDTKTYDDVITTMKEKGYYATYPVVGETYSLGGATFTIVAPNEDYGNDMNNWSVGVLLQNGDNRFLFTGDAGEEAEEDILENGMDISADVYKVSHHGSDTGSSEAFLGAVSPTYAVISVGEDNSYGHPAARVLNDLRSAGVEVFRTDEQGTIVAVSDGTNITWNCSPSETWKAGESRKSDTETETVKAPNDTAEMTEKVIDNTSSDSAAADGNAEGSVSEPVSDGDSTVMVHITETGSKYHLAGCQYLKQSDYEVTLAEAKARGLEPCSKCNPPQ